MNPRPTYKFDCTQAHCVQSSDEPHSMTYTRKAYVKPAIQAQHHLADTSPLGLAILLLAALIARKKWKKGRKSLARKVYLRKEYHD